MTKDMKKLKQPEEIRDMIYFDEDRVSSLLSQLTGGIELETTSERSTEKAGDGGVKLNLQMLEAGVGGHLSTTESESVRKKLHHYKLNLLMQLLCQKEVVTQIDFISNPDELLEDDKRSKAEKCPFVIINGYAAFEPIGSVGEIGKRLERAVKAMNEFRAYGLESNPEYVDSIKGLQAQLDNTKDREKKSRIRSVIKGTKREFIKALTIEFLPQEYLDAIKEFGESLYPNQINVRLFGKVEDSNCVQAVCNLRDKWLVNDDAEQIAYDYSYYPLVKWTVFGLITRIPLLVEDVDRSASTDLEEQTEETENENLALEVGFSGVFSAYETVRGLLRSSDYPRFVVTPIAVYRRIPTLK